MKFNFYIFCIILLYSLNGCKLKKDIPSNQVINHSSTTDSIVFAHFFIEKKEYNSPEIQLTQLKKYSGTLKMKDEIVRNDKMILKADFYSNEKFLFDIKMTHPLYPTFEMYEKDKMNTETVSISNATFVLRFKSNPSITKIIFKEIIHDNITILNTINIQP